MAERPHPHLSSTIVCVGGGISGIALGAILKRQYSFTDVHFYEREKALGGTWFVNTYPGRRYNQDQQALS